MRIAYFDCFSGISGDMVLGALLDLGVPLEILERELRKIPLTGYSLRAAKEVRGAIVGTRMLVEVKAQSARAFHRIQDDSGSELAKTVQEGPGCFEILPGLSPGSMEYRCPRCTFMKLGRLIPLWILPGGVCLSWLQVDQVSLPVPVGRGFVKPTGLPLPAPATASLPARRADLWQRLPVSSSAYRGSVIAFRWRVF